MKQLLNSLKDTATTRLKNPILGAFVFCWMSLNIKGLAVFLLSNNSEKLEIVKNWQPTLFDDAALPLSLTFAYLVLLPWLHLAYQALDEGVITRIRQSIKNKALSNYYSELRDVNERKIDSNEEYISRLKEANIINWPDEKKRISAITIEQRKHFSKKVAELSEIEKQVTPKLEANAEMKEHIEAYLHALTLLEKALTKSELKNDNGSHEVAQHLKLIHDDLEATLKGEPPHFSLLDSYKDDGIFIYRPTKKAS
jgi:soluble cytochrome b562